VGKRERGRSQKGKIRVEEKHEGAEKRMKRVVAVEWGERKRDIHQGSSTQGIS